MKKMIFGGFVIVVFVFSITASTILANDACEGNFDFDKDVDGTDAFVFKEDFGRSILKNPCKNCPPPARVPKTGLTKSYATGDDGDLEKGVTWPNPRFTDNLDGTITDNLTGLIWLKNANCFGARNWNDAISDCNTLANSSCGLTDSSQESDWRLPNYKELFSLVDAGNVAPPLPSGHPFTNVESTTYWSSTTLVGNSDWAWSITMHTGYVFHDEKYWDSYVWPVRGGH